MQQLRPAITSFRSAFPDLHYDIDDLLADRDNVILRCRATGTHIGTFMGIASTGKNYLHCYYYLAF